jgi:hypothetical protein
VKEDELRAALDRRRDVPGSKREAAPLVGEGGADAEVAGVRPAGARPPDAADEELAERPAAQLLGDPGDERAVLAGGPAGDPPPASIVSVPPAGTCRGPITSGAESM